jgi:hypothetical protein
MCRRLIVSILLVPAASIAATTLSVTSPAWAAATSVSATVRQWVNVRNGPAITAASVGSLSRGQQVTVICQDVGNTVNGPGGSTNMWDRIGEGRFVSHSYLIASETPPRCDAVPAPKAGLTAEQTAFMNTVGGPAMRSYSENRVPASVTIAQAILESGWGRSDLARIAQNYFGARCNAGWPGPIAIGCQDFPDHDCDASGCHAVMSAFRVFASVLDSLRDHGRTLSTTERYAPAFAYSTDPNRFAAAIHKAGYATDPGYTEKLTAIMAKYDLYRYDR